MNLIPSLVNASVFNSSEEERIIARKEIHILAKQRGIYPASIHDVYMKFGKGELSGYTIPAFNVRNLTFDFSKMVFRVMKEKKIKHVLFEIARGEVGYTGQTHDEYATSVLAGAIADDWVGPVYIQADHTQFSAQKFIQDPAGQEKILKECIKSAIDAGFYNIDIDASTLVDLKKTNIRDQQKENARMTAALTQFIRTIEPVGVTVSIGGEIGHIGGKNSTQDDFEAFMELFKTHLTTQTGLSKVSVQTGTHHGGTVLPDGTLEDAVVDFSVIETIGKTAREKYGMGGVVQHGASTLPTSMFHEFPKVKTLEIHLATGLQTIIFDNMPPQLKEEIYMWLKTNCALERTPGMTDEQFYYTTRKRANSAFKEKIWNMKEPYKQKVMQAFEEEIRTIFKELKVENTA